MAPKFDPGSCSKPEPSPAPSCLDLLSAHLCVCKTCTCGTHKCVPALTSKFQPLDIKPTDIRMHGITEYIDKYHEIKSGSDRNVKDNASLLGCYPLGLAHSGPVNTEFAEKFEKKPIFPAKLWVPKTSQKVGPTFSGQTVYGASYKKWASEPRYAFKPPGFIPNTEQFDDRTTYGTHFKDRSKPEKPRRKLEHWPHNYTPCEVCHPIVSGAFKTKEEDIRVVNTKGAHLDGRTTYNHFHYNPGKSQVTRSMKLTRWGPKVEPLDGSTTYSAMFRRPPNKDKILCPVMMRPMPTNSQ
ncbi:uncharacterized protein [Physcomitrium patens]|uniref:Uncharacterized protein n=1 Tax=Physcomitrium patens TaxID=3218 RepID=A0A2K1JXN7_PHYPA|nr:uncharacterized protein LOC112288017 [Physcomitrium patens]PNR46292.1 hypothetical protein PHYPA_013411 [Physcomitrium patens]|eukprot:XP_024387531.1 uncharacterized protein LOC112288017 [Physcomitrella patens]